METIDAEYIPLIQTDENNDDSVYEDTETSSMRLTSKKLHQSSSVDVKKSLRN